MKFLITAFIIWNVSEDREAALPVDCPGRYDLAVFSRSPSSPVVTLGNWTGVLSWDPEANMVTTFTSEPRALPAFIQHNFTVECSQAENHFRCDLLVNNIRILFCYYHILFCYFHARKHISLPHI